MRLLAASLLMIALLVAAARMRRRLRLRHPALAEIGDAIADRGVALLCVLIVLCVALVALGLPGGDTPGFRLVPAGLAVGFLTGIPFAAERRTLRARLREAAPPPQPLPAALDVAAPEPGSPQERARTALLGGAFEDAAAALGPIDTATATAAELRLRALVAAASGDARLARACALRAAQVEPGAPATRVLAAAGLLLSRGGGLREGVRLLERACELDRGIDLARLGLVEALRHCDRLRDAVAALDGTYPPTPRGVEARVH